MIFRFKEKNYRAGDAAFGTRRSGRGFVFRNPYSNARNAPPPGGFGDSSPIA